MTALVDLRSDTVTRPGEGMRRAMLAAELGDDVFGDDPTVNRLQAQAAALLGFEDALFFPSGTQSNLAALMSHCQRGDEVIVGQEAHTYKWEGGGAAVLGSVQPQPLDFEPDGTLDLERVAQVIKPDDPHFVRTRLLCLENTHHGKAVPLEYLLEARDFARAHGLKLHLDGARVWNAAVKLGVDIREIAGCFDSVSFCLSKGLGAPVGSLLCSTAEVVRAARRWRKALGGGMRQAGILAAAGIYALESHVDRLEEDHRNAARLAAGLGEIDGLEVDFSPQQTNMVFVRVDSARAAALAASLREQGVLISGGEKLRLVTHLDVDRDDVGRVVEAFRESLSFCDSRRRGLREDFI